MTEAAEIMEEIPATPAKAPPKRRKKKAKAARKPRAERVEPDRPVVQGAGDLAGISATRCPTGCNAQRCVISTIDVCKHPFKTGDNGCGPVTMANRARAKKLIKHQMIDMKE